jgi:hypothetical protein
MPPDQIVLTVNASFAIQKDVKNKNNPCELLFDSSAQPLPPGARSSGASSRQLLYRIGSVYIDMEVGKDSDVDRVSVVGQMLDCSRPGHPVAGIPVTLLDRGRNVARTLSNDSGEFRLVLEAKKDLRLSVVVGRKNPVRLPITDANLQSNLPDHGIDGRHLRLLSPVRQHTKS